MDVDDAGTSGGVRTLASAVSLADREPGGEVRTWLDRRHLSVAYALFLAYAALDAILSAGRDQIWAIWRPAATPWPCSCCGGGDTGPRRRWCRWPWP